MSARTSPLAVTVRTLDVRPGVLRRLAATQPDDYPALFDSVAMGPLGQMSILAARPRAALWQAADGALDAAGMTPQGGGFLAALAEGCSYADAARFANAVGALSVQKLGAINGIRTRAETEAWLHQ